MVLATPGLLLTPPPSSSPPQEGEVTLLLAMHLDIPHEVSYAFVVRCRDCFTLTRTARALDVANALCRHNSLSTPF